MINKTLTPVEFIEEFQTIVSQFCSCQKAIDGKSMAVMLKLMKVRMQEKISTYAGEYPEILMFEIIRLISMVGQDCNLIVVKGKRISKAEISIVQFSLQQFESWFYEMMVGIFLTAA